jgi:hypothetical protein
MYEWLELPPENEVVTEHIGQPFLQEYMKGLKKTRGEEAAIMKLRIEMAKRGEEGVNDVMTPEHKEWTENTITSQMEDIVKNKSEYPPKMVEEAEKKLDAQKRKARNIALIDSIVSYGDEYDESELEDTLKDIMLNRHMYSQKVVDDAMRLSK